MREHLIGTHDRTYFGLGGGKTGGEPVAAKVKSVIFPAYADGVRYIVVVTLEAIEAAAGTQISEDDIASWAKKNIDAFMTIVDRVRPRPTKAGARVYIKSHHLTRQSERKNLT